MQLTLTNRLRLAALTRAEHGGRVVGTYVIDSEGVIDLRALEDRGPANRASDLASLGELAGKFEDAADVSNLYYESSERIRRRFRRPARPSATEEQSVVTEAVPDQPDRDNDADNDADDEATIEPTEAEDAEVAGTPIPAGDSVAAGDRVDPEPDPPAQPPAHFAEPEPVIDLRDNRGPSSMQSAIIDFNQQRSGAKPAKRDIESGILFGHGGGIPKIVDQEALFDDIDLRSDAERGALFGGDHQTRDLGVHPADAPDVPSAPSENTPFDARPGGETGAVVVCPMCGSTGTRDFANRFLEIDFYSCGNCFHMWHLASESTDD